MPLTLPPCWRRRIATLLAAATAFGALAPVTAAHAQVRLPALGESANDDLSVGTERRLGDQIMASVRRDPAYLDDPLLLEYVQSLWRPLLEVARQRGDIPPETVSQFAWETFLVRDRSVNAFALPGGWVGVHLGLIAITASRDELASVLAHELTHVSQRHIARSIDNSARASWIGMAALLLGVIAASRSNNADMANAAIMAGQGAALQGQLNFSRDMEREADRVGFGLLTGAGFSAAGMASMFEKLESANRLNDNNAFPYLRSHPLTGERIGEARSRVLLPAALPPGPPLEHALMQARARVLMDTAAAALRRQQEQLDAAAALSGRDRAGALYAGALASSMLGDHARAAAAATEVQRVVEAASPREIGADRAAALLRAQVMLAAGDGAGALAALDRAPAPGRPALLLGAQAVLEARRQAGPGGDALVRASVEQLQTWLADHRTDAAAWSALAAASDALGLKLRAIRAGAEAQAALGDVGGAIDRLRAGQQAARSGEAIDFIESSVIDARLRELQAQRRQALAEARGGRGEEASPPR